MKSRLQFIHHNEVFATREAAIEYVKELQINSRPSLFAEPIALKYESGDSDKGPNIILAIGSHGIGEYNDEFPRTANRTFFIDITAEQEKIEDLDERLEAAIKALTLIPLESDTLKAFAEKTEDGTYVSGDVKVADAQVIAGIERENTIKVVEDEGLYHYVDLEYTEEGKIVFRVNDVTKEYSLPTLKSGEYIYTGDDAEKIILTMNDGSEVKIDVGKLIDEWTVVPADATTTPIVLTRKEVSSEECPHGVEVWQDILTADIRLHEGDGNILYKHDEGRTLYAKVALDYNELTNSLVFQWSENGEVKSKTMALNSVKTIEYIRYDAATEEIIIGYRTDGTAEIIEVKIPVDDLITEWTPVETGHNIVLKRDRSVSGTDEVYADLRIADSGLVQNNILEVIGDNKAVFVRGEADNIKFGEITVDTELKRLDTEKIRVEGKLDEEIARATNVENTINSTIGDGFSTDAHETVTYKFNALSDKLDDTIDDLNTEVSARTDADNVLQSNIDAEKARAIAAEETLQTNINNEIVARSLADTELQSAITEEKSARISGDTALQNAINTESGRASSAESKLETIIGTGFTTDNHETVTYKFNELSAKTDTAIGDLEAEREARISADTELSTAITNEVQRAQNAESGLQNAINTEKTRAEGAEGVLTNKIGSGFTTDPHENITAKFNELIDKDNALQAAIEAEEAARISADTELSTSIANEAQRAQNAESGLSADITAETDRATAAETALQGSIEDEGRERVSSDEALDDKIEGETNRATGVEQILTDMIGTGFTNDPHDNVTYKFNALTDNVSSIASSLEREISRSTTKDNELAARDNELYTQITDEATRSVDKDNELDAKIASGVAISADEKNLIERKLDGLMAFADLTYNGVTNVLTFKTNKDSKEIGLVSNSIVDKVYYQPSDETIVIEYTVNGHRMPDVVVPVGDLINEWVVNNSGTTVNLTKTRKEGGAPDELSADVRFSSKETNILATDAEGLYAEVDLNFDEATNRLTFKKTNAEDKVIPLFGKIEAENHQNTVEVIVSSITENNTKLYKIGSRVNISTAPDNILTVVENDQGEFLKVSNSGITRAEEEIAECFNGAEYDGTTNKIIFKHDDVVKASMDATPFTKDGMVDNVVIDDGYLVISFNADAAKESIRVKLTDIFNPGDYYTKSEIDEMKAGVDTNIQKIQVNTGLRENYEYNQHSDAKFISGATNIDHATVLLDKVIEEAISNVYDGSVTPSVRTFVKTEESGLKLRKADVRLSHYSGSTASYNQYAGDGKIDYIIEHEDEDKLLVRDGSLPKAPNLLKIYKDTTTEGGLVTSERDQTWGVIFDGSIDYGQF